MLGHADLYLFFSYLKLGIDILYFWFMLLWFNWIYTEWI